jgi:ABC-type nitrate/sulfonate/bicarbonate transport system substrate-binding protein
MSDNTLWYTRCPLPTAFSVAIHAGLLESHVTGAGGAVQSLRHSDDQKVRLSHFTHTYPGMIRQGGHIPPLWSRAEGKNIKLIGLSWTNEAQLVLTLPDSDIQAVSDLKGKRLAVPVRKNFPIDFWRATVLKGFSNVLATAGLSLADVELVEINIDDQPFVRQFGRADSVAPPGTAYQTLSSQRLEGRALLLKQVDAIFSPGHYGVALSAFLGAKVLFDLSALPVRLDKLNNSTLLAFTVDADFLDRHPETVLAALRASVDGARYAKNHTREAGRIVAAESGNAEELIPVIFGDDFAADLTPGFSDELLEALERQNHFLFKQGFLPRQVPVNEWIAPELLKQAVLLQSN